MNKLIYFINKFSSKDGNLEFVLSNSNISKILFWSKNYYNNEFIINYIFENLSFNKNISNKLKLLFEFLKEENIHIGYDSLSDRYKIYSGLYNYSFENCLKKVIFIKDILGVKNKYFLEKDFLKFDCIGIDISENKLDIKIYELINKNGDYDLIPNFLNKKNIKEIGYLKNLSSRKKLFFRFLDYENILLFKKRFDLSVIDEFQSKIKDFYILQKKVKYYCLEGNKEEIYFI